MLKGLDSLSIVCKLKKLSNVEKVAEKLCLELLKRDAGRWHIIVIGNKNIPCYQFW